MLLPKLVIGGLLILKLNFLFLKTLKVQYVKGSFWFLNQKLVEFFLSKQLEVLVANPLKVQFFNSYLCLNKFNNFELILNYIELKKNFFKFSKFLRLASNLKYLYIFNFLTLFFICLRFKHFGLFSKFICAEIGLSKKQRFVIKNFKNLITNTSLSSFNLLGLHILIKGTIGGRKRTTRYHIIKFLCPSKQNFCLESYYSFHQSISIHGVLGIKIWFFF